MDDAQSTAEETAIDGQETESQEQTPVETDNGSEAEQNTSEDTGGDLRVPLKEERTRRQELEAQLSDPDFIYQKAQELGLTQAQAEQAVNQAVDESAFQPQGDVQHIVRQTMEIEKAKDKYPELSKDKELGVMVTALMNQGLSPLKAADKVFERFNKVKEEGKTEGAVQTKTEISDKERAQTVSSGSSVSSDQAEIERLTKDSKSLNSTTQKHAMIELLKKRNKEQGII